MTSSRAIITCLVLMMLLSLLFVDTSAQDRTISIKDAQIMKKLAYDVESADYRLGARTVSEINNFHIDQALSISVAIDNDMVSGSDSTNTRGRKYDIPPEVLIAEAMDIKIIEGASFTGKANITASECHRPTYDFEVIYNSKNGLPNGFDFVFVPGVIYRLIGHVCIPAKGVMQNKEIDVKTCLANKSTSMSIIDGRIVASGPMLAFGRISVTSLSNADVVEMNAIPNDTLVFKVTKDMFIYVSGSGTVVLPGSSKIYEFPHK